MAPIGLSTVSLERIIMPLDQTTIFLAPISISLEETIVSPKRNSTSLDRISMPLRQKLSPLKRRSSPLHPSIQLLSPAIVPLKTAGKDAGITTPDQMRTMLRMYLTVYDLRVVVFAWISTHTIPGCLGWISRAIDDSMVSTTTGFLVLVRRKRMVGYTFTEYSHGHPYTLGGF